MNTNVVDLTGRELISPDDVDWQSMSVDGRVLDGIKMYPLTTTPDGWQSYWMKLNPGVRSIMHRHSAVEMIAVMRGSLEDCDGATFNTSEVVVYPEGSTHLLSTHEGCILLVVESKPSTVVAEGL
ncbi:ChrR Cupin-like domain-containing protein [Halopseudomonas litoralis]|uniref:ChrR Cupin-like domain-containing protein n=1 Tax=Halopseudomonas litoralis TaxID=797277 RepID=A0A1H1QG03_9GAMM|nr:cupin domain-containing protein [Halopseudomonas litoralis]SDS22346.1 ChrR Cupin-like domain-containing protein [Halopseudomonas litoralis]